MGQIQAVAWFVSFTGTQSYLSVYISSMDVSLKQTGVVASETIWPVKPKIVTI